MVGGTIGPSVGRGALPPGGVAAYKIKFVMQGEIFPALYCRVYPGNTHGLKDAEKFIDVYAKGKAFEEVKNNWLGRYPAPHNSALKDYHVVFYEEGPEVNDLGEVAP